MRYTVEYTISTGAFSDRDALMDNARRVIHFLCRSNAISMSDEDGYNYMCRGYFDRGDEKSTNVYPLSEWVRLMQSVAADVWVLLKRWNVSPYSLSISIYIATDAGPVTLRINQGNHAQDLKPEEIEERYP